MVRIAIIGGTGLDDPEFMSNLQVLPAPYETPYGLTTDLMVSGCLNGIDVVLIGRHGRKHKTPPSAVNYRANIYAICSPELLNCDAIIATNAVGSLRGDLHRVGDLVIVDQFIDFTAHGGGQRGPHTFYDAVPGHLEGLMHCPMAEPFCRPMRHALVAAGRQEGIITHDGGCCVVIEGPRFSSKAEHKMFRQWGADIANMTMVPEVCLANEMGIPYATVALITDLDSGSDEPTTLTNGNGHHANDGAEESVSHDMVLENMKLYAPGAARTIARALPEICRLPLKKMRQPPSVF